MAEKDELNKLIEQVKILQEEVKKAKTVGAQREEIDKMNSALEKANEYYKDNKATIESTAPELKKQLTDLEKTNKGLQSMLLINKGISQTFTDMSTETAKFARSTDEWFKKGEKLAEQYLKVSRNIGLSENRSRTLTTNFNNSVKESLLLGYSLDDLRDTFDTFAEETGRARILSSEEAENIAKVAMGANLYSSEATKMAEQFDLMGISSEKMVNLLNESIRTSREMGLNSNKVIKVLQQNMSTMQQYSFSRGVKGMVEMSKLAVKMRMDVSEMLSMADKFYEPEAAIEAAANLQMLGGDIAQAFGDPFTVMYEARNKPEELAKRVGKMTENMVSFNEQTGEFDFPAEARMQLQAVSKELGIGMDSLTEMTRQASKIKSIKMNVSGNVLDENLREGIAGMARMKDGKWVVDFEEGGKTITQSIDNLTSEQAKLVLDQEKELADKTEKDFLQEIALNTQTFSEKVANIGESQQYGFAGEMDVYSVTMDSFLKDSLDTYRRESQNMMESLTKSFGDGEGLRNVLRDSFVGAGTESMLEEEFRTIFSNITNSINKSMEGGKLDISKLNANATDVNIFTDGIGGFDDVKINSNNGTYVMGPKGTFKLNEQDEYYGKDGTFTAGTNLGIDKPIKTIDTNISNTNMNIGGTANININIKSDNPSLDISSLKSEISSVVTKMFNNGGMPDGANLPQGSKGFIQTM
jgi:predicted TIM-barrel fold metal-dependent hydrolase